MPPKLLTSAVVGSLLALAGLSSSAEIRLPAPPPPPLPSPSGFAGPPGTGRSLGPGDFGGDVEALQLALNRNGIDPGPIDGDYGPMTSAAVSQFQEWYDLPVTGIAGPATLDILGIDEVSDNLDYALNEDLPYVAAITESSRKLGQVQQSFGNARLDSARQGEFISIGRYSSRSAAAERVREARRLGFDARTIYQR